MATEIERKFLVPGRFPDCPGRAIVQAYLNLDPERTVRVRIEEDEANLNIKGKSTSEGLARPEFEYPIPRADARTMLELAEGSPVEKVRHRLPAGPHTWEIDVFHGDNEGLVVAEIELTSEAEAFERPEWLGEEVTHDHRYKNASLAQRPWRDW